MGYYGNGHRHHKLFLSLECRPKFLEDSDVNFSSLLLIGGLDTAEHVLGYFCQQMKTETRDRHELRLKTANPVGIPITSIHFNVFKFLVICIKYSVQY